MGQEVEAATWQVIIAAVVFLITYILWITDKMNRAIVALAGAAVMLVAGIVPFQPAFTQHMDWRTIGLLAGMMVIVGMLNQSGVLRFTAVMMAQKVKGSPVYMLIALSLLAAAGSAVLNNMLAVMLIVPVTIAVTRLLKISPVPFLISEIIAANAGGTATLIGSPTNMLIGSANAHLTFNVFILTLAPVSLVILLITIAILALGYRNRMIVAAETRNELMQLQASAYITNPGLMYKSLAGLLLTWVGYLLHSVIPIEPAIIAIAGAVILLALDMQRRKTLETLKSVDWVTLGALLGLFILIGGLTEVGVVQTIATKALELTSGSIAYMSVLTLWLSGIVSATTDHIPFVATMIPIIKQFGADLSLVDPNQLNPVWWSLALGAGLGGSGSLIGASANVIVAGLAARDGKGIGFIEFLRIGTPVALLSLLVSTGYLYLFIL